MRTDAVLSADGLHRFELSRDWSTDSSEMCALTFVMLNPSTADASQDDPTIRRCIGFARTAGFARLWVVNLYSLRTASPAVLWRTALGERVRSENDEHLSKAAAEIITTGGLAVAAWGAADPGSGPNRGDHRARIARVVEIFHGDLWCYGTTTDGSPRHPLYLPAVSALERWTP